MNVRIRKRTTIAPGVHINFSQSLSRRKDGTYPRGHASISLGGRGATANLSDRGLRYTVGIPGTGIYAQFTPKDLARPQTPPPVKPNEDITICQLALVVGVIFLVVFALSAHGGDIPVAPTAIQQKAAVNEYIHTLFKDPYSVQDLLISTPYWNTKATAHKDWIIRFQCNAKNSFGAYIGMREHFVMWKNGGIDWPATKDHLTWQAFADGMREGLQ